MCVSEPGDDALSLLLWRLRLRRHCAARWCVELSLNSLLHSNICRLKLTPYKALGEIQYTHGIYTVLFVRTFFWRHKTAEIVSITFNSPDWRVYGGT